MTPNTATWGEFKQFLAADNWTKLQGTGKRPHDFYEKVLPDGRILQTHASRADDKTPSPGRFRLILREQLEVTVDGFWEAFRTGEPVKRPQPDQDDLPAEHDAWVVAVLVGPLHLSAGEVGHLSREAAEQLVHEYWSRAARQGE